MSGRTGRRPGDSGARGQILEAARQAFAGQGYDRASIRGIARAAGVDPALVHHYFGTKRELFAAALTLPLNPAEVLPALLAEGADALGQRLVRLFVETWDATPDRSPILTLVRSSTAGEDAVDVVRGYLTERLIGPLADALAVPDARLRVTLAASQMVGVAMARYVIRLEPLASAPPDTIVAAVGPTVHRYLLGSLTPPRPRRVRPGRDG